MNHFLVEFPNAETARIVMFEDPTTISEIFEFPMSNIQHCLNNVCKLFPSFNFVGHEDVQFGRATKDETKLNKLIQHYYTIRPTRIMVDGGGINWCWYSEYEIVRDPTNKDRASGKLIWSDRFHKFDERQGAGNHPTATHNHLCGTSKPVLRVYAREMTPEELKREQDSFDFFWKGWASWCKRYNIDPSGTTDGIFQVQNRETKEVLIITTTKEQ